jgi:hypothetical protein
MNNEAIWKNKVTKTARDDQNGYPSPPYGEEGYREESG